MAGKVKYEKADFTICPSEKIDFPSCQYSNPSNKGSAPQHTWNEETIGRIEIQVQSFLFHLNHGFEMIMLVNQKVLYQCRGHCCNFSFIKRLITFFEPLMHLFWIVSTTLPFKVRVDPSLVCNWFLRFLLRYITWDFVEARMTAEYFHSHTFASIGRSRQSYCR